MTVDAGAPYSTRVRQALADDGLRSALDRATGRLRGRREQAMAEVDVGRFRDEAGAVRRYAIEHLPDLLEQLEGNLIGNGCQVHWARDAAEAGADAFSIGVECKSWSGRFGGYWRSLIEEIRSLFGGLLTYSANWDEAEDVLFWDRLDVIGINAFYPLAEKDGAPFDKLVEGGRRVRERVHALAETWQKPVLFTEIGYTTRPDPAIRPWEWPDEMKNVGRWALFIGAQAIPCIAWAQATPSR